MKRVFRRVRNYIRSDKIRYKYFFIMLCLSILPLLLLGFISFNIAKNTLVQNQVETTGNNLRTSSETTDLLFRNIINMERVISWSNSVRQELVDSAAFSEVGKNVLDENTTKRMQDLISSYFIDTEDIDSVCLFDVHFRPVCYGNHNSLGSYDTNNMYKEIYHSDWYKKSVKAQGRPIFFSYNVLVKKEDETTFSSVKLLRDPQNVFNPKQIGLLVVNIKKSMFSRVLNDDSNSVMAVIDSSKNGVNTVFSNTSTLDKELSLGKNSLSTFRNLEQKGYLISSYTNNTTGWTFANITKEKELLKQSNKIGIITITISTIIALIALLISYILSGKVARPWVQLKKMTVDWAKGLWGSGEDNETDTIGVIGETFQRITVENKELNERLVHSQLKEREAELRALQAQIKPHFLYNTLDSIYWMAILQNNKDIAEITVALSQTFKLSLNNGEDLIPISKELEHIHHYMTIQNFRYQNRFQYIEDVDSALLDKPILKLLLQPFIENAIYHGLEPKVGEGTIKLIGRISKGWITFTISDNGVGIEDLERTERGYGIKNVYERIKLFYGQDSTLFISSKINEGTCIEISFRDVAKGGVMDVKSSDI
ncbi:sensor histidine kinase [Bacillus sp. ISL-40]|uniref:sensor histidine kinase n=1 Tax=unclassified Bacillus (in: firmicutes) TaxID=185979 RepID=UPI001BE729CF|nr:MULTISPECIES: histidine kinase [unclassified Bacillus (in: firmicutes)]MBT2700461.1 sensor histidine kinase [Bacillus sp. ISL-40]MBT2720488.1 sensor histidine kinase [Bacillus sp. ISL-46]MBT2744234.1 sensor histidine kinase [Bacillus sp. ISL-77]